MKKIFTLLFAVGIVGSVVAQGHSQRGNADNDRNNGYNKEKQYGYAGRDNDRREDFSIRMRDEQISKINCDFDARISAVKNRRGMWFEKNRQIRRLENERKQQISMVYARFSKGNDYSYHHNDNGHRY